MSTTDEQREAEDAIVELMDEHLWTTGTDVEGKSKCARAILARELVSEPVAPVDARDALRLDWIARQGDEFVSGIIVDRPGDGDYYVYGCGKISGTGATFLDALDDAMADAALTRPAAAAAPSQHREAEPNDSLSELTAMVRLAVMRGYNKHEIDVAVRSAFRPDAAPPTATSGEKT